MLDTYNEEWIKEIFKNHLSHEDHEGENNGVDGAVRDNPLRASYRMTFVNLSDFDEVNRVKNRIDEISLVDDEIITNRDEYIKDYIIGNTFRTYGGLDGTNVNAIKVVDYYKDNDGKYYLLFTYLGDLISSGDIFEWYTDESTPIRFQTIGAVTTALVAACSEGYIFVDGYFIYVPQSNIIASPNSNIPDEEYYIGYDIIRTEISSAEDSSLNDNAHGSYNYKAPGANRYKLEAVLASYTKDNVPSQDSNGGFDFITGIVVKNGDLIKEQSYSEDTAFMDLLAKRTYEESGSYTVEPWKVQIKDTDDESKYKISIGAGTGYIHGYRVSTLVSKEIENTK